MASETQMHSLECPTDDERKGDESTATRQHLMARIGVPKRANLTRIEVMHLRLACHQAEQEHQA